MSTRKSTGVPRAGRAPAIGFMAGSWRRDSDGAAGGETSRVFRKLSITARKIERKLFVKRTVLGQIIGANFSKTFPFSQEAVASSAKGLPREQASPCGL